MVFVEQKYKLLSRQDGIENKELHSVLERLTLCFSSYKDHELKVKM